MKNKKVVLWCALAAVVVALLVGGFARLRARRQHHPLRVRRFGQYDDAHRQHQRVLYARCHRPFHLLCRTRGGQFQGQIHHVQRKSATGQFVQRQNLARQTGHRPFLQRSGKHQRRSGVRFDFENRRERQNETIGIAEKYLDFLCISYKKRF